MMNDSLLAWLESRIMWSDAVPKGWNQLECKDSPHNPSLPITDARLPTGARDEANLDYRDCCRSNSARRLGSQGSSPLRVSAGHEGPH